MSRERARAWLSFQKEIFWQGLIPVTLLPFHARRNVPGEEDFDSSIQIAEVLPRAAASCETSDSGPSQCLHVHGHKGRSRKYLARETTNHRLQDQGESATERALWEEAAVATPALFFSLSLLFGFLILICLLCCAALQRGGREEQYSV